MEILSSSNECERLNVSDVLDNNDCNDGSDVTFPGSAENDSTSLCLTDADNDGYAPTTQGGTDCDDGDSGEKPGVTWYVDLDGDTFGDLSSSNECERSNVSDVLDNNDCDDGSDVTFPGSAENDSTSLCLTDADNDGYAPTSKVERTVKWNGVTWML